MRRPTAEMMNMPTQTSTQKIIEQAKQTHVQLYRLAQRAENLQGELKEREATIIELQAMVSRWRDEAEHEKRVGDLLAKQLANKDAAHANGANSHSNANSPSLTKQVNYTVLSDHPNIAHVSVQDYELLVAQSQELYALKRKLSSLAA